MKFSLCAIVTGLTILAPVAFPLIPETLSGVEAFSQAQPTSGTLTAEERAAVVDQFVKSKQGFIDRIQRFLNPDALAPKGKFKTPDEAIAEFTARRGRHIEYARTTTDDLRAHFSPCPGGTKLDAYQFLLLTAAHSARHTAQIKEVEANPKYPVGQ